MQYFLYSSTSIKIIVDRGWKVSADFQNYDKACNFRSNWNKKCVFYTQLTINLFKRSALPVCTPKLHKHWINWTLYSK